MERTVRSSKGFLIEADDTPRPVLCRDLRGFPAAVLASADRSVPAPDRLVIVVPDLAMEDWLSVWADDVGHPRRTLIITRRTDGQQIRAVCTLLAYGYGVDTAMQVERLDQEARPPRAKRAAEEPVRAQPPDLPLLRKQVAPAKRRAAR
jgi:hypothetical protein